LKNISRREFSRKGAKQQRRKVFPGGLFPLRLCVKSFAANN